MLPTYFNKGKYTEEEEEEEKEEEKEKEKRNNNFVWFGFLPLELFYLFVCLLLFFCMKKLQDRCL